MHPQWICITWFAELIECQNAVQDTMTGPSLRIVKKNRGECVAFVITSANGWMFKSSWIRIINPRLLVSCIFSVAWLAGDI